MAVEVAVAVAQRDPATATSPPQPVRPGRLELFRVFFGIGLTSFGMAILQNIRSIPVQRGWLSRAEIDEGLGLVQLYPGAIMVDLVAYIGYRTARITGALAAAAGFVAPSLVLMLALSWLYEAYGAAPGVASLVVGLDALVVGVVASVAVDFARQHSNGRVEALLGLAAFAVGVAGANLLWAVLAGLVVGALVLRSDPVESAGVADDPSFDRSRLARSLVPGLVVAAGVAVAALGSGALSALVLDMAKIGTIAFGNGSTILPILQQDVVESRHWLSLPVFGVAIGFGQITPGPFLITAAFVGYHVAGFWGGVLATVAIFAPSVAMTTVALAALRDQSLTIFVFVLHPEATAIAETRRAGAELARLGIVTTELIVNGILPAEEGSTPFFASRIAMQERYLAEIARQLPMPTRRVPLLDGEIRGVDRLRALVPLLADEHAARPAFGHPEARAARTAVDYDAAVKAALLPNGTPRTIFYAGKGGVGKTVASCATAVWLARQGHRTLLVTTDPAAHIGQVLGAAVGTQPAPVDGVDGLWAARVDAKAAAIAYTDRIIADAVARGRSLESVAAMREELDSPCTEEMAAFDQFIELASRDSFDVTVFDTAPTGHTMRLLELPIDWSRQIDVKVFASVDTAAADDVAKAQFSRVIEMMRDPAQSTFCLRDVPGVDTDHRGEPGDRRARLARDPARPRRRQHGPARRGLPDTVRPRALADAAGLPRRH